MNRYKAIDNLSLLVELARAVADSRDEHAQRLLELVPTKNIELAHALINNEPPETQTRKVKVGVELILRAVGIL